MAISPPTSRSVMLVDDRDLFRAGLKTLLEDTGLKVAAQCGSNGAPVHLAQGAKPDVILIDSTGERGGGPALVRELVESVPGSHVLVLSASNAPSDVIGALRAGARGYILKSTPIDALAAHVETVAQGGVALGSELMGDLVDHVRTGTIPGATVGGDLSAREVEVLRLVARGMDNNQVAEELGISAKTVKNHLASIFAKLEVVNRVQAAVYAVRTGLG